MKLLKGIQNITDPIGWPNETAPPLMLIRSGFSPSSFSLASTTQENASLISHRAMSSLVSFAFLSSFFIDSVGEMGKSIGSRALKVRGELENRKIKLTQKQSKALPIGKSFDHSHRLHV